MPSKTRAQRDEENSTMVIGIDFGTTFSGVAFAHSSRPEHIQVVSNWIDGRNTNKGKCPTLLTYNADGSVASWGYGAVNNPNASKWFKLLLLKPEDVPQDVRAADELRDAHERMMDSGKQPLELAADFLKQLWRLAYDKMTKSVSSQLIDNTKFHVVLSVPAIWPDYAKEMMLEAARCAGICNHQIARPDGDTILDLISEPEAAALATMMDNFDEKLTSEGVAIARPGDCFVVCDAGGGTADLITYKINSVKPWTIEECVKGDGKLCGAVMLDKAFRTTLQSKVSPEVWSHIYDNSTLFGIQWERIMNREYTTNMGDQILHLPINGNMMTTRDFKTTATMKKSVSTENEGPRPLDRWLTRSFTNDLRAIFDPVIKQITKLVRNQISAIPRRANFKGPPAKYVVLVGGLGSSQYLYECLKEDIATGSNKPEILQSEGDLPWTSIARGAVLHGFNQQKLRGRTLRGAPTVQVQSRIARRSYGTICTFEKWDPRHHRSADRRWCPVEDCYVADSQMSWFVRAGEAVNENEIKLCAFTQTIERPEDLCESIITELVFSDALSPPKRRDTTVRNLCEIRWERAPAFNVLPERVTDAGRAVRDINYDVEMIFSGATASFGIWHDTKKVASQNVIVKFQDSGSAVPQGERQMNMRT